MSQRLGPMRKYLMVAVIKIWKICAKPVYMPPPLPFHSPHAL